MSVKLAEYVILLLRSEVAEVRNGVARDTQGDLFHPGIDRAIVTPNTVDTCVGNCAKVSTTNH